MTFEDSMPSKIRMIQAIADQEVSELSDEMVRLAAAKDAEIAALKAERDDARAVIADLYDEIAVLTEQRDRAMKVARALSGANVTWPEWDAAYEEAEALFAALDAEAAAEPAPSLPETPEA